MPAIFGWVRVKISGINVLHPSAQTQKLGLKTSSHQLIFSKSKTLLILLFDLTRI